MGHQRLGDIPKTQRWNAVVAKVAGGGGGSGGAVALADDLEDIASETLVAAGSGLSSAIDDSGLRYTFYVLTQIVLAARESDWQAGLKEHGISLAPDSTLFDFTAKVQVVIDDYVRRHGRQTAISEMAQRAAGEAIASLVGPRATTLFGSGPEELKDAVRELSTKKGFSHLGQKFFGCFMARFLNFYLSRITPQHVGTQRLSGTTTLTEFNESLARHCFQSAKIVHDFCGEWYSKTEFQRGINLENTSGFMAIAVKKLQAELQKQREER